MRSFLFSQEVNVLIKGIKQKWTSRNGDLYEKAMEYIKKHLRICEERGDLTGEGMAYFSIGNVYRSLGQYKIAMEYFKKHLRICEERGDLTGEGMAYSSTGLMYYLLGQYEKAMEYFKKHLRICEETGDLIGEGMAYFSIGNVYRSLGQYKIAMECFKKNLLICEERGDLTAEGMAYSSIGTVYRSLGQYKKALEYYMKHLRICEGTGDSLGEGMAYGNIGNVHQSVGQYEKAMEYLTKCLRISKETGDLTGEGKSYCNIGLVYHSLSQYDKAMEYFMKHLRICIETGRLPGEGKSYCNIGLVYHSLSQYDKAMEYFRIYLHICKETGDLTGEGLAYSNIGNVYHSLGQYMKALEYRMECLRIFKETGGRAEEGMTYANTGLVYNSLGQYEKAMEYFQKHLRICEETGNLGEEGTAYDNIGVVYQWLGQYEKAMEYHTKHLCVCEESGDLKGKGSAYGNIGNVCTSLGQYEKALENIMKCLRIFKETGNLAEEGKAYGIIGILYYSLGQYEKAMECHMRHLCICEESGDLSGKGSAYGNIGKVYKSLGEFEKAMEYLMKCLTICKETGGLTEEGFCYYQVGRVWYLNDNIHRAEDSLKKSLRCFQEVFKLLHYQDDYKVSIVDTYIEAYQLLTRVLITSGKEEEALLVSERGRSQALRDKLIVHYGLPKGEEVSKMLNEDIKSLVAGSESSYLFLSFSDKVSIFVIEQEKELFLREKSRGSFAFCTNNDCSRTNFRDVVESYVNNLCKSTREDAIKHQKNKGSKSIGDRSMNQDQDKYPYQQVSLDDPISSDDVERVTTSRDEVMEGNVTTCEANYSRKPIDQSDQDSPIREPQSKQAQRSQPVFGTTALESKQQMHDEIALHSRTKVPRGEGTGFSENSATNCDKAFGDLYEALIAPVEEALTKPEIVIIPDGPLFFVPFAALKDKSGKFLSETKSVRLGPSLTTLKLLKECPAEKHCKQGALIVGGPTPGKVMYRGKEMRFSKLPFARQEANMVGDVLGEKALTGSLATKDEFKRRLQEGVAIIHIATHGDATTGELVFAPGPSAVKKVPTEEDYLLTVNEIYSSAINAQLVVLSCCHSGLGEIKAEGVVGLTRAFLAAGARSVLASLWAIDDAATYYFMKSFYQHLISGESASASLQQAMKEMRKIRGWSHPYFWAPFFIVGDDIRITT